MKVSFIVLLPFLFVSTFAHAANSLDSEFSTHEKLGSFSMEHSRAGLSAKTLIDEAEKAGFFCRGETFGTTCEKEVKDLGMCGIIWNLEIHGNKTGKVRFTRQAIIKRCI